MDPRTIVSNGHAGELVVAAGCLAAGCLAAFLRFCHQMRCLWLVTLQVCLQVLIPRLSHGLIDRAAPGELTSDLYLSVLALAS